MLHHTYSCTFELHSAVGVEPASGFVDMILIHYWTGNRWLVLVVERYGFFFQRRNIYCLRLPAKKNTGE